MNIFRICKEVGVHTCKPSLIKPDIFGLRKSFQVTILEIDCQGAD